MLWGEGELAGLIQGTIKPVVVMSHTLVNMLQSYIFSKFQDEIHYFLL